ncbi:MAG: hypothetical protein PHP17_06495, partial [Candidatus Omnitrophica bacterium]|nr:hypothetical protein [Candidatus Omnitrophota bacterium]
MIFGIRRFRHFILFFIVGLFFVIAAPLCAKAQNENRSGSQISAPTPGGKDVSRMLEEIKDISSSKFGNFNVNTNVSDKHKKTTLAFIFSEYIPGVIKHFSFEVPDYINVFVIKDKDYRNFLNELGLNYSKMPYGLEIGKNTSVVINADLAFGSVTYEVMRLLTGFNLPQAPVWIEDGFPYLYETIGIKNGSLVIKSNKRLGILKKVIDTPDYVSIKDLSVMGKDDFYKGNNAPAAAEARYIMFYLHKKGLLKRFYREYKATQLEDKSGIQALQKTVGLDIRIFEGEWLAWVRN